MIASTTTAATMRRRFSAGLEAALGADAERFAQSKAGSVIGTIVKGLVQESQRGRAPAIRLVFSFLDRAEVDDRASGRAAVENKQETDASGQESQGLSEEIGASAAVPGKEMAGGTPAVPGTEMDWSEAGDWIASAACERETKRAGETIDSFFAGTEELRARFEAEPPGSSCRVAQWRASAEALARPFENEQAGKAELRLRLLRIAKTQLAEEESLAALRAAGSEGLEIALARSTANCARWPRAWWMALFAAGTSAEPASATAERAPPHFTVRVAGRLVEP